MGKITGFLEYEREDRHYEPVEERIKHWRDFVRPRPEEEHKKQAARCMDCGVPYCHTGCPVNNQIPDWNALVDRGNWEEATRNLHSTNNFPEITGRICPAPCEAACTLNIEDNPVTIKTIECAIADRAFERGWIKPEPAADRSGKKVAIVGSGPGGLACAQQLARAGHDVHVFEKFAKAGGLLTYGIPDFKMEKHIVARRVAQMEAEGVTFHYNAHVGVVMEGQAFRLHLRDAARDDVLLHLEIGDPVSQQSASLGELLEHMHVVAGACQLLRAGQSARTRADDGHFLTAPVGGRLRFYPASLERAVGDRAFDGLDGDGIVLDVERAGGLARRRADAAGDLGEIVGGVEVARSLLPVAAIDEGVPVRDLIVARTAGVAEGNAAFPPPCRLLLVF